MPTSYAPAITSTVVGIQGPPGNGAPGTTTRDGTGAPSNTVGIDGDFYIDHATGNQWKRISGTYAIVGNLTGPQGNQGTTGASTVWRSGAGAPNDSTGNDGDLYLVTGSGDLYQRASGHYGLLTNIRGTAGVSTMWRSGTGAPVDGTGIDGDLYLVTGSSDLYQRVSGHYTLLTNIKGATGATGASTAWRSGSTAPSDATGNDGDLFLLTTTGDVYQRTSGHYGVVANIKGGTGATGPQFTAPARTVSGTTDAPSAADNPGTVTYTSNSPITVTANDLGSNIQVETLPFGTGQITIAAGAGVTLVSASGQTSFKTARQYSSLVLRSTGTGVVIVMGEMA